MQAEYVERLYHPKMEYYREVYKNSVRWNGADDLKDKDIIIYCEQGFGDTIQFVRYIPKLKEYGCRVHLHCPSPLHRLLNKCTVGIDSIFDKEIEELPKHDYHSLTMSLPFVLGEVETPVPYIHCNEKMNDIHSNKFKIGIAWEGNPDHSNNGERSCPLGLYRRIHDLPEVELYTVQQSIHNVNYIKGCEDMCLYGASLNDFYDTATLMNSMDLIVSIDTSVLHLAGSLARPTIGLLSFNRDGRWDCNINWYPNTTYISQTTPGDWETVSQALETQVKSLIESRS